MGVLRARIAELEAENAHLQTACASNGSTPRSHGAADFAYVEHELQQHSHSGNGVTSPVRANQPAAAVLAAAGHRYSSTTGSDGEMARVRGDAPGDVPASQVPAHALAVPRGTQLPSTVATLQRNGAAPQARGAAAVAVASTPLSPQSASLRDDFVVAAHRLKVAQRQLNAWLLLACFHSWRHAAVQRRQAATRSALLLRRVLRRAAAQAFLAWKQVVREQQQQHSLDEDGLPTGSTAASPLELDRLLATCPLPVRAAFESQRHVLSTSLSAADEAAAAMQRHHAAELADLRMSLQAQTEALARAVSQLKANNQQQQYSSRPPRVQPRPPQAPPPPQAPRAPPAAAVPPKPAAAASPMDLAVPVKKSTAPGPSRMNSLLAQAAHDDDQRDEEDDGDDYDSDGGAHHTKPPPPTPAPTPLPPPPPPTPSSASLVSVAQLVIAGWTRHEAIAALEACHGRIDDARAWLIDKAAPPRAAPPVRNGMSVPGTPTIRL